MFNDILSPCELIWNKQGSIIIALTKTLGRKLQGPKHGRANVFSSQKCPDPPGPHPASYSVGMRVIGFFTWSKGAGV